MEKRDLQVIIYNKDFDFSRQIYNCFSEFKNINIMGVAKSNIELNYILEHNDVDILIVNDINPEEDIRINSSINMKFSNGLLSLKSVTVFAEKFQSDNNFNDFRNFYNEVLEISEKLNDKLNCKIKKGTNIYLEDPKYIAGILEKFGINDSLKGYTYLIESIILMSKENEVSQNINNLIYSEIAIRYNTTIIRVAKTIHHAIDVAWTNAQNDVKEKYFPSNILSRPSDQEFIASLLNDYIFREA